MRLEATIDQITVLQELGLRESRVVFPAAEVRIEDRNSMLTLTSPDNTWAMRCEDTPESGHLVRVLREMSLRTLASPASQPPLPAALAKLRGAPESS